MSKKTVIFSSAATLIAGIVIGSSGGASTADTAAATPEVRTVTEEVEVTPQACLDALTTAEAVADETVKFIGVSVAWPGLVQRAMQAGMDMDVSASQAIVSEMQGITSDYDDINADTLRLVRKFNASKYQCRTAG